MEKKGGWAGCNVIFDIIIGNSIFSYETGSLKKNKNNKR